MASTQGPIDAGYLREIWGLYIFGAIIILLRIIVRARTVGVRKFQGDDYITFLVLACFTADAVGCYIIITNGTNVDYTPQQLATFTDARLTQITFGTKMQLFA